MPNPNDFSKWYVNCWCFTKKEPWTFVPHNEAEEYLLDKFGDSGICTSLLRYAEPNPAQDTLEYGELYFDFDSPNPIEAKHDAEKLIDFFVETLILNPEDIKIFYSGSKGFHIYLNPAAFGIRPMPYLRNVYSFIAITLKKQLGLNTLDMTVYNKARLIRYPNSKHQKTSFYKILLDLETFYKKPLFYIQSLAKKPGKSVIPFNPSIIPNQECQLFWETALQKYQEKPVSTFKPKTAQIPEDAWGKLVGLPACIDDIMERFIFSGIRHAAQARVVAYLKATGVPEDETIDLLSDKIQANYQETHPPSYIAQTINNMASAIKSIYRNEYLFTCAFALSLTKDETDPQLKIRCDRNRCPLFYACGNNKRPLQEIN